MFEGGMIMHGKLGSRHIFMILAIAILLLSPVFVLLGPLFIANTLYHTSGNWYVFVSGASYIVYSVGCLLLFFSALILCLLDSSKPAIYMGIVSLILGGFSFVIAAQNYTNLADESISYRDIFSKEQHTYSWDEIERVVYKRIPRSKGFPKYEFHFTDGNKVILAENGIVERFRETIESRLGQEGIEVEKVTWE